MDERLEVVDEFGNATGRSELKSVIHTTGAYHNTAHVWFYTMNGQILLAQRSSKKHIYPLLWDVSVAGHVDYGETIEEAAIRETMEEIDLMITHKDLIKIGVFDCFQRYENGIIDNEFHHTFIALLPVELKELNPQEGEVEALKLVSTKDFINLLQKSDSNMYFIKSNSKYYMQVLRAIEDQLND